MKGNSDPSLAAGASANAEERNADPVSTAPTNRPHTSPSGRSSGRPYRGDGRYRRGGRRRSRSRSRDRTHNDKNVGVDASQNPSASPAQKQHRHHKRQESKERSRVIPAPAVSANQSPENDHDDDEELCPVCVEPVSYYAFGSCQHPLCHLCCLRLRVLYRSKQCSLCKTELESVLFVREPSLSFQQYDLSKLPSDKKLGLFCEDLDIYEEIMVLLRLNCPDSECDFFVPSSAGGNNAAAWKTLKQHLSKVHKRSLCDICVKHKRVFAHEHVLFTHATLERHCKTGDPDDPSFRGHPECEFCREYFYSVDELFDHCRQKHETCHICQREGIHNQYYKDYDELEKHFEDQHFLCKDPLCLEKKFVVFTTEIDFKAHLAADHPQKLPRYQQRQARRIDIDVQYAPTSESSQSSAASRNFKGKGRSEPQPQARDEASGSSQGISDVGSSQRRNRRAPPGFGKLSKEEEERRPAQSSAKSQPCKIFLDDIDPSLRKIIESDISIKRAEEKTVPLLVHAMNGSREKWNEFQCMATNYLRTVILAEKFFADFEALVGYDVALNLWKDIVDLFPDSKKPSLLRVYNDRKTRAEEFPMLESTASAASAAPSRARVLVIKSQTTKGGLKSFRKKQNSNGPWVPRPKGIQIPADDDGLTEGSEFPSLSLQRASSSQPQQKAKKPRPKGTLLLSTALPASSSPSVSTQNMSATQGQSTMGEVVQKVSNLQIQSSNTGSYKLPTSRSTQRLDEQAFPSLPMKSSMSRSTSGMNLGYSTATSSQGSVESVPEEESTKTRRGKKVLIRFG